MGMSERFFPAQGIKTFLEEFFFPTAFAMSERFFPAQGIKTFLVSEPRAIHTQSERFFPAQGIKTLDIQMESKRYIRIV